MNLNLITLLLLLLQSMRRQEEMRMLFIRLLRDRRRRRELHACRNVYSYLEVLRLLGTRESADRRFWELPRPDEIWFDVLLRRRDLDYCWKEHFRVNRSTFMKIVDLVRPHMETKNTNYRPACMLEKKVAAALWRLANGHSYRSIGLTLGMGKSSATFYTHQFCEVMCLMRKEFVKIPGITELPAIITKFGEKTKIPNVVAIVDGSHIPIKVPTNQKEDYFNRKHRYSVLLQGIVGPDLQFFDVFVGVPGSVHDSRLLRLSKFGRDMEDGLILQQPRVNINGFDIGPIVLGDSAYTLKSWLFTPYSELGRMPVANRRFNEEHVRGRVPVEIAFGHLKGRWRILNTEIDEETSRVKKTIMTCCILHNICVSENDSTPQILPPPESEEQPEADIVGSRGELLRDIIADYIVNDGECISDLITESTK